MIELLILYSIKDNEKTIYSIKEFIKNKFGYFTLPSTGTISPAIKKMLQKEIVSLRKKISDGGKVSTYYTITKKGFDIFSEMFMQDLTNNPTIFFDELNSRIATFSMLKPQEKIDFIEKTKRKLELMRINSKNIEQNKYIQHDDYQKALLEENINHICYMEKLIEKLS